MNIPETNEKRPVLNWKKSIFRIPGYAPGKPESEVRREFNIDRIIKMASNENPLGPSKRAREALVASIPDVHIYPDSSYYSLRQKLSEHMGLPSRNLIAGAGSVEVMKWICESLLSEGDEAITADLSFPVYHSFPLLYGATPRIIPLDDEFHYDLEAMIAAVNDRTRVIFIASPNNPTGLMIEYGKMADFLNRVPANVLVVFDLAYIEYTGESYGNYGLDLLERHKNLVILRTFSKIHALAGLRVGYGMADEEIIGNLDRVRGPFSVSTCAERAAIASLDDEDHVRAGLDLNEEAKAYLEIELRRLNLDYYPTSANFLLIDLKRSGMDVYRALLEKGLIVRPIPHPRLETKIRVTTGTMEQNEIFIRELGDVL